MKKFRLVISITLELFAVLIVASVKFQSYCESRGMVGIDWILGAGPHKSFNVIRNIDAAIKNNSCSYTYDDIDKESLKPGDVVYYFKWGCPDCNGIHKELVEYLSTKSDFTVYKVCTKKPRGEAMLSQYYVDEVPSLMTRVSDTYYVANIIYTKDSDGHYHLDKGACDEVFQVAEQQLTK